METLFKDLKVGVRALGRMPGSAVISVLVLALGIGLCSFMFSVVYGVYYRGLDVPEADRIFALWRTQPEEDAFQQSVPVQDFADWRERQRSFSALFGVSGGVVHLGDQEVTRRYDGARVTANAFDVLRVRPILGRTFIEGDDTPGAPPNVILGYATWRDDYGLDPDVIGRSVRVSGEPAEIIGVMPEGFRFPSNDEVWTPYRLDPLATPRGEGPALMVMGRLRDGVDRETAEADIVSVARSLEREHPESNRGFGARLETPAKSATGGTMTVVFTALMIAVFCVLLVACANVANLLLARAATRGREAGVRIALGASRLRVMTPFFAEALILAAAGAVAGIVVANLAVGWFDAVTDPARTGRPYFIRFTIDAPILVFVVGVTGLTALLAGLAPAWRMSRTDVITVLKDESRGTSSLQMGRVSRVLVTAEVALSCALLIGAGLMTKSIVNLRSVNPAYSAENLFVASVDIVDADYPEAASRVRVWDDVLREVRAIPSVARAALTSNLPMSGGPSPRVAIAGETYENEDAMPLVHRIVVSPGYFETVGAPVTAGRDFVVQDDAASELVAVVNEAMVERYFGGRNAVGSGFREGAADSLPEIRVVGVVPDLDQGGPVTGEEDFEPAAYYIPMAQTSPGSFTLAAVPRAGDALALTSEIRSAVGRANRDVPMFAVMSGAEHLDRSTWFFGVFGTVFIVFGAAALFMASVGLYGVLSFAVSRRTHEMGVRMALGADARDVTALVVRQGAGQLGVGLAIGLAMAFGLTRLIGFLMHGVDPQDPVVFGGVVLTIVVVGMAASVFPALRATGVDPSDALRLE